LEAVQDYNNMLMRLSDGGTNPLFQVYIRDVENNFHIWYADDQFVVVTPPPYVGTDWNLFSLSRKSNVVYMHLNGQLMYTKSAEINLDNGNLMVSRIAGDSFNGFISEIRHTVGVGRYDGNNYQVIRKRFPNY